jgi:hypothetical protein
MGFDGRFVKRFGLALDDPQSALGAFADASTQTVAQVLRNDFNLTVHDGQGAFGATDHALTAAVAFFFIDLNDFAFYFHSLTQSGGAGKCLAPTLMDS